MHDNCIALWAQNADGEWGWRCNKYLMSRGVVFKEDETRCYHYRCEGRKPRRKLPADALCQKSGCEKVRPKDRPKYCSKICQKRANDEAYRARRKLLNNTKSANNRTDNASGGKKVSVYLDGHLLKELNRLCEERGEGKSKILQDALRGHIIKARQDPPSRLSRTLTLTSLSVLRSSTS